LFGRYFAQKPNTAKVAARGNAVMDDAIGLVTAALHGNFIGLQIH
jgi:hypothetical protein